MTHRAKVLIALATVASGSMLLPHFGRAQQAQSPLAPIKIGVVNSLFRDVPAGLVQMLTPPLQGMLREQTGLQGDVFIANDFQDLGKQLHDNEVQFGVFHGFEFAWAQQKYPDLKPLVIAVARHRTVKAYLVVRDDASAKTLLDLKGKALSVPRRSREYCLLFLDRELARVGSGQQDFFSGVVHHASMEEALDDVLRDKVQAALVDAVAWDSYEQVKPGCFARLKVLVQSDSFPPGVVAYHEGALDASIVRKLKEGLIGANQTPRGRELMALWKLAAFENVPADLQQSLENVVRTYPPPK
jgi:ABC-type phosphate/phosphonate transport system substrate-binding protein